MSYFVFVTLYPLIYFNVHIFILFVDNLFKKLLFAEHNSLVEVSAPSGISYQSNVEDDICDSIIIDNVDLTNFPKSIDLKVHNMCVIILFEGVIYCYICW